MAPTNDTGSPVIVGPDSNGNIFEVATGEEYDLPEPVRTVAEDESETQGGEEPPSVGEEHLGDEDSQPPAAPPEEQAQPQEPPADEHTEGDPA